MVSYIGGGKHANSRIESYDKYLAPEGMKMGNEGTSAMRNFVDCAII